MRVLHVTSDWKWTGPAAPMLTLLGAQRARGDEAQLVCPPPPPGAGTSLQRAARRSNVEPALEIARGRGALGWRDGRDVARLRDFLRRRRFDVLHVWHTRDHVLALRASAELRRAGLTRLVRSWHRADPVPDRSWNRWLFGPATDGLWCVSPGAVAPNTRLRSGRPLAGRLGAVDLRTFQPRRSEAHVREALGLRAHHRVVAIAARAQPQRRFDLLLAAMRRLADTDPDARLLVIGRGTRIEEVVARPASRLGLAEQVVFAGYRGADYADVLRAADVFTLLAPGSDGGCRALLEAAACGLPAVATRRGAMPEIVVNGETGWVVDEDAGQLAEAWRRLLSHPRLRASMGAAARARAEGHFAADGLAADVDAFYQSLYREAPARALSPLA